MHKRFTHLINKLDVLDKPIYNDIATNKVFMCLNREWKPKVTPIKQANDLKTLNVTTLFGKLEEHEQELTCMEKHEKEHEKEMKKEKGKDNKENNKSSALNTSSSKSSYNEKSDCESRDDKNFDDEDMRLFVKRYQGYIRKMESSTPTRT